ncbi:outer membrane efflux protein [Acidisarcina polymorpha]|uniref:Outer membrane efflux protein n=2 Tax=Acidisarcina polymorpha TaxID=2211140 RepID=A0A2Z5G4M6_9BACT|nr:outer membrane efflux protein [Acidisarcina polymorpha]
MKESKMQQLKKNRRSSRKVILPIFLFVTGISLPGAANAQTAAPLSLTLSQAIDLALKQDRSLLLARLSVIDKEHKKEIARSDYFPHIKNESSVLHLTELAGVDVPAGAFGVPPATGPIPARSLFIGQGSLTSYTSGTGLAQPFTQMFKIHESNRAAIADINTAKIQVNQAEDEIALKVRQLYYGLLIGQLRLQAAADEVNANQVKVQESADAVTQGRALDVVALESRATLLDAKQTELTQTLQIHDLTLTLNDILGIPLKTELQLDPDTSAASISTPSREECISIARQQSPEIRVAQQAVIKAKAALGAAKDAYIPDVTGLARYSYQSGVPLLVHNFGTFGLNFSYDLFDGGRRNAEIRDAQTVLSQAELNLAKIDDEVTVQVEAAYDKVEQLKSMVGVAEEALGVRTEAARLTDRQYEQNAALASARVEAHAKATSAKASLLEATLGLSLAQGELKRTLGQLPR